MPYRPLAGLFGGRCRAVRNAELGERVWDTVAMRILVAEDETIIRLDLRGLLERAGFDVVAEARDGL